MHRTPTAVVAPSERPGRRRGHGRPRHGSCERVAGRTPSVGDSDEGHAVVTRRNLAIRIAARGVPTGLVALHRERGVIGPDGRAKVRGPGPSGPRQLHLAAADATGELAGDVDHGTARRVLAAEQGRRGDPDAPLDDDTAIALARAGLLRLRVPASKDGDDVVVGEWRAFERTRRGDAWSRTYAEVDTGDPLVAHAVGTADQGRDGDAEAWHARVEAEVERVLGLGRRAVELVNDGSAHGSSVAEFADAVTGDPQGLESGPVAQLVLADLARSLGLATAPRTDGERAALLAAAGIGATTLASTVAVLRLPGGAGAVGALLSAAVAHDVPVVLHSGLLHDGGGRPVAPPGIVSCVFAVQHAATLEEVAARQGSTPVVVHGGSPAAVPLLQQAIVSGWRVVVATDGDDAGRARRDWLLERLGEGAEAWRADGGPGETAGRSDLLADITAGRPAR